MVWKSRWSAPLQSWPLLPADSRHWACPSLLLTPGLEASGWMRAEFLTIVFSRIEGKGVLRARKSSPPASSGSAGPKADAGIHPPGRPVPHPGFMD